MAKLDDFGRPIYETAEEYNKAHKGGVCPRPYDDPEGGNYQQSPLKGMSRYKSAAQRHSIREGSEKAKVMVGGIIGVFAVIYLIIMGVVMINTVGNVEYGGDQWVDVESIGDGDETTPLPEGFETFSYNGETYSLPVYYEDFAQFGFHSEAGYEESDLFLPDYEEVLNLTGEDGYVTTSIRVANYTGEEIPIGKCKVDCFWITNPVDYDEDTEIPDFVFGDELTFESSYEELENYFGTPSYHYSDYSDADWLYDNYEWMYYGDEEMHYVSIVFINGVMENVSIEKRVYEEEY